MQLIAIKKLARFILKRVININGIRNIIFLLFLSLGIFSCEKTHCPGFPDQLVDYMPYVKGDTIRFRNNANDTLSLKVAENSITSAYSFSWNCKCSCEADAVFSTEMDTLTSIKIEGVIVYSVDSKRSAIGISIYDGVNTIDEFGKSVEDINPFIKGNDNIFGDTIFNHYKQFNRFNDLTIVKGEGIIQFWDEKLNCLWVKIN